MRIFLRVTSVLAGLVMVAANGPAYADDDVGRAEKLRRLDIMLMVTALRCRNTKFGFQPDYNRFSELHLDELNQASRALEADLARKQGPAGAKRALDRMSVVMANSYGLGHPTLGCEELQAEVRELARESRPGTLLAAADRLLVDRARTTLAAR